MDQRTRERSRSQYSPTATGVRNETKPRVEQWRDSRTIESIWTDQTIDNPQVGMSIASVDHNGEKKNPELRSQKDHTRKVSWVVHLQQLQHLERLYTSLQSTKRGCRRRRSPPSIPLTRSHQKGCLIAQQAMVKCLDGKDAARFG